MPNILVFLPSIKNIKDVTELINNDTTDCFFENLNKEIQFCVEELHGGLKPSEKQYVMRKSDEQSYVRIILATRIAETALTLDNIVYVLDSGMEREYFFDEIARLDYLQEQRITLSSATQRQGRAGRVRSGFCYKMYTQEEEEKMPEFKEAEILRTDISDVILNSYKLIEYFKLDDLLYSEKLDKKKMIKVTQELLRLGALENQDGNNVVTNKGNFLIQMNLKLRVASLLYETLRMNIPELGILAASALKMARGFFKHKVSYYFN